MKTILITGASSGIGLACTRKLSSGNKLILCSRNLSALENIKSETGNTKNMFVFSVDVTSQSQIRKMFESIESLNLYPDVLINSAGVALGLEKLENGQINEWDQMIDTNVRGLLMVSKFALTIMKERNSGHIINIGSIAGITSYSKGVVYAATKAAVKSISDGLRKEVIENKIKITNIQPGLVETNFSNTRFGGDVEKAKNVYKGIKPLSGDDIADIIKYVIELPEHVQINEITVTPLHQATVEVIHRNL
jgi:NADP-dependent 3-hydroxy acid dehydrogenase YdfG